MKRLTKENIMPIVREKESMMRCNCDLDKWIPEETTGHSWVCRIHRAAMATWEEAKHE